MKIDGNMPVLWRWILIAGLGLTFVTSTAWAQAPELPSAEAGDEAQEVMEEEEEDSTDTTRTQAQEATGPLGPPPADSQPPGQSDTPGAPARSDVPLFGGSALGYAAMQDMAPDLPPEPNGQNGPVADAPQDPDLENVRRQEVARKAVREKRKANWADFNKPDRSILQRIQDALLVNYNSQELVRLRD